MTKVLLDDVLRTKLNGLADELELCDQTGQTVGHFVPADLYRELLYAWAKAQFTDEEIALARQEPGGFTTAEAIAYLEKLVSAKREAS